MSRQIELALLSLIPTLGSDLPPSLVELASSLLSQSRNRASTLKADEEIARHYACAHIACDRMKITLDLPPIVERPPIPPRIYKRLYTHLNNVLPNASASRRSSGRVRTPVAKFGADDETASSPSSRKIPSRATPTKQQSLAQFRKATAITPKKTDSEGTRTGLAPWIAPAIRFFCTETGSKKLAPTILAGMETILLPEGRKTDDEWAGSHAAELLAAVLFFVTARFQAVTTGQEIDKSGYVPIRKEILGVLERARKEAIFIGSEDADAWEGWSHVKAKDFDAAVEVCKDRDWFESDWYRGIAEVAQNIGENDLNMADADEADVLQPTSGRRADTMLQDRYDYLSDERRAEYKAWKDTQMARMTKILEAQGAMQIDTH
ncbi:hypothetical protein K4F52_010076 [Lecanicillium sp. MT-2017a]|nr:hypothetical protein K4F52_010076 [Lecanicillium sp. MT-2017a]